MDRLIKIKTLFILFAVLFLSKSYGQEKQSFDLDAESIYMTVNQDFFVTGENLYYTFNSLNSSTNTISQTSKIGYIELIDNSNNSLIKQKLSLKNGLSNGAFFITTKLKTGFYKIIGYTHWTLNNSKESFFQKDIFILNQFENGNLKSIQENIIFDTLSISNKSVINSSLLDIKLTKKNFLKREKVTIQIIKTNPESAFSFLNVSVQKITPAHFQNIETINEFVKKDKDEIISTNKSAIVMPDYRGEIISGKITSKSNLGINEKTIALCIPSENFIFTTTKTNSKGEFYLTVDNQYKNTKAIVQIVDENKDNYNLEVYNNPSVDYNKLKNPNKIFINNITEIKNKSIYSQIENSYYSIKKDSTITPKYINAFFDSKSKEYKLNDFKRFSSLKETVIEIIPEVQVSKFNNKDILYVLNSDNQSEFIQPALVLVDGFFIQDMDELFNYSMNLIDKININVGGYVYHSNFYNGVISFTTKNQDFETKLKGDFITTKEVLPYSYLKELFEPQYNNEDLATIPDNRYLLKWIPNFDFTSNQIEFYTSDIQGTFEIKIEGILKNGTPVLATDYFTVK